MSEPNVPENPDLFLIESYIEKYKSVLASGKELSNGLKEIRENYIKELHDLLGSKVNEYLAFRQKIRDGIRDINSVYRPTPEGEKVRSESEKKLSAEAREFRNSLGIDSNNVKNIQNKYHAQSHSAVEKAMNIATTTPYAHATSIEKPERTSMEGWIHKTPPYDNKWGSTWGVATPNTVIVLEHYANPYTTELVCENIMQLSGAASNNDFGVTHAYSEILIWFRMPTTGFITAIINLTCRETPYSGCLKDEVGFSDAEVEQRSWCYLGTSNPQSGERTEVPLLQHFRRTDDEGCWSDNFLPPHSKLTMRLRYEHKVFPAGKDILVAIGIHDLNSITVNDMGFNTSMTSYWYLPEVWLTSTYP